jgi:hypothetical protein
MKTDDPSWVNPALDIIRRADPGTYARMQASPWMIHVIATGREHSFLQFAGDRGIQGAYALAANLDESYAVTPLATEGGEHTLNMTFVNKQGCVRESRTSGIPVAEFLASILVHEFSHNETLSDEKTAYDLEIAFDKKMGSAAMAALDRQVAAQVAGGTA